MAIDRLGLRKRRRQKLQTQFNMVFNACFRRAMNNIEAQRKKESLIRLLQDR